MVYRSSLKPYYQLRRSKRRKTRTIHSQGNPQLLHPRSIPIAFLFFHISVELTLSRLTYVRVVENIGRVTKRTRNVDSRCSDSCTVTIMPRSWIGFMHIEISVSNFPNPTFPTNDPPAMVSTEISYGLFLADHQILDLLESELLILPAIMCQNLRGPTLWHLRGCLHAGISRDDVEQIQQCIEMIARFAKRPVDNVGRVSDVKDEMHNM